MTVTLPKERVSRNIFVMALLGIATITIIILSAKINLTKTFSHPGKNQCNVAHIFLEGELTQSSSEATKPEDKHSYTVSDNVLKQIEEAENNSTIKGVVLEIESSGGSPVAGEEIANALKRSEKPNVALIKDIGASAAYFASTGANRIYASALSDVGSIGITGSYTSKERSNAMKGITYNSLSMGKFKDSGDQDKPLSGEERVRLMDTVKKTYDIFVAQVAENRHLKIEEVYKLADGATYVGNDALKLGLIDSIGGMTEVKEYLSSQTKEDIVLCEVEDR